MSQKEPRSFDAAEKDTIESRFQERKYMDSLMGGGLGEKDARSEKRREEAREYDEHLRLLKESDTDSHVFKTDLKDEDVFKDSVTEINPTQKEIDHISMQILKIDEQILKIENDYKNKDSAESDRLSTVVEKDLASKKALRDNKKSQRAKLIAQLQQENAEILPKTKDPAEAVLDTDNIAATQREHAEDEAKHADANIPSEAPNTPDDDNSNPDVDSPEGTTAIAPTPAGLEPVPEDPEKQKSWFNRHRNKLLAGAAASALFLSGIGLGFLLDDDKKDNQRNDIDENTEQPAEMEISMEQAPGAKQGGESSSDRVAKNLKFNQNFSSKNHSGNKVNAWGTERSLLVENAPNGELKGEARNEYIGNHDKITAANVEKLVNVRFQEMHGLDAAKFNSAWGQSEREKMKREYLSDSGHSLSEAGKKAHSIHLNILRSGKTLKMTAAEAADKYDLDVNSYIKEGKLKGGIDDTAYAIGNAHGDIYVTFDDDGNIEHAEQGECANEVFFIKGSFTPSNPTPNTPPPTTGTPPPPPPPSDEKGPTFGSEDNDHQYGNNGEIHENDGPEDQEEAGSGNPTNPAPVQTERPQAAPTPEAPAPTPTAPATGPVGPSQ